MSKARGSFGSLFGRLHVAVLLGMLAGTASAAWLVQRVVESRRAAAFALQSYRLGTAAQDVLDRCSASLIGTGALFASSNHVQRIEWRAYLGQIGVLDDRRPFRCIGYAARVDGPQLEEWLAEVRGDGAADATLIPPGRRAEYFLTQFVEPPGAEGLVVGRDLREDARWRIAAEAAWKSGGPLMVPLDIAESEGTPTCRLLAMTPVGSPAGRSAESGSDSRTARGWVFALLDAAQVQAPAATDSASGVQSEGLEFAGLVEADGVRPAEPAGPGISRTQGGGLVARVPLRIGASRWLLHVAAKPPTLLLGLHPVTLAAGVAGVAMSAMICIVLESRRTAQRALKRAEEINARLKESEHKYRRLFENSTEGFFLLTDVCIDCNRRACDLLGLPPESVIGRPLWEFCPESQPDGRSSAALIRQQLQTAVVEGSCVFYCRMVRGDGTPFDGELLLQAVTVRGRPAVQAGLRDVTASRSAELSALRESGRLRAIISCMEEGVALTDGEGRIIEANDRFAAFLGIDDRRIDGRPVWELGEALAPERLEEQLALFRRDPQAAGVTVQRKMGQAEVVLRIQPIRGTGGFEGLMLTIFDVTDLVRSRDVVQYVNQELARRAAELESARLASLNMADDLERACAAAEAASRAKSEFLANMSHEIRTPMTAILGYTDVLIQESYGRSQQEKLAIIKRNGEHLLQIINDILDLSKIEAGKMAMELSRVSPVQVVAEVKSLMRVRAEAKSIAFEAGFAGPVPEAVRTDPTRLRQVLINLIGNAIKFTETGEVRLTARLIEPPAAGDAAVVFGADEGFEVKTRGWRPRAGAAYLRFDVIDTGIGMTAGQMAGLFRPFSQADGSMKRQFGGTGLGLSISLRLAEMLGGTIAVRSRPGEGSIFAVAVETGPLDGVARIAEPDLGTLGRQSAAAPRDAAPKIRVNGRILLAEDGPDNQRLISFLLRRAGAEVTVAENGRMAVEAALEAEKTSRPFDLILMDMQMPELDGYGATGQLRQAGYTRPIIALTAHAMAGDREKCIRAGCDDYATKPIDQARLLETVARQLANRQAPEPQPAPLAPLLSTMAGDADMAELIRAFVSELPQRVEAIARALDQEDLSSLARLSHQLKGSAGGYGFPAITDAAAVLEGGARARQDLDTLRGHLERLADLCRRASAGPTVTPA